MAKVRLGKKRSVWKGLFAGLAGGLAGTCAMTQFQNGWSKVLSTNGKNQKQPESGKSEDATQKTASALARLAGQELTPGAKKHASSSVHYVFGTSMGALYGTAMETVLRKVQHHSALSGAAFGSALFVGADEIAVPRLGLSSGKAPLSSHLYGFASHLVYGLTAGLVYQAVRKAL